MALISVKQLFFYLCMLSVNLLGIVAGMALSWSSPVLPKLGLNDSDKNPLGTALSDEDISWIGSLLSLGAGFGPFIAAYGAQKFGRKWSLVSIGIVFIISYIMVAVAETLWLYFFARTLVGLAVGGTFTVLPMYIAEMSADNIRGTMGGAMNVFIVSGIFLSYVIGPFISILWFSIVCAIIGCVFVVIFTLFMPDTPQWLVSKSRETDAKNVLRRMRNMESVDEEFDSINQVVQENSGASLKDIFMRANIKALGITIALVSFQQFSGINIVLSYAQQIFDDSGSSIPSDISPIIIGGVQVCASVITPLLADKTGRKFLLIFSAAGMIVAEIALGVYFYLKDDKYNVEDIFWLPIASLVLYIIMYNCGFGALPWTVTAEVFLPNVKGMASSLTASCCWLISFVLTKFFTQVSAEIGIGGSFWLFAGFNAIAIPFVFFLVPETKGKSQMEIHELFKN